MSVDRFDLSGRRVIVTGGARGLGLAMGMGMARAGAEVWALDILEERFEEARAEVADAGVAVEFVKCDVSRSEQVAELAARSDDRTPLVLLNNAGIGERTPMMDLSYEEWSRVMDVTSYGVFACARAFGAVMLKQGRGSIVNIASVHGFLGPDSSLYAFGGDGPSSPAYCAAKGSVISLTRSLAAGWAAQGVRVNSISPGMFITDQTAGAFDEAGKAAVLRRTPMARFGRPDDLVGAAIFLASDASSFVTGHNLVVDGGWSIW
ncbi:MAG: SDR family oxidoreductase [bacterium]|nr:SDR family oxidoreductase [bacterium]